MFGTEIQRQARSMVERIVRPVAALGISPNIVTFIGLALNGVAAAIIAAGSIRWGGAAILFAGIFDMFDGAVARVQQKTSLFGAFFDSTLDRYAEGALFLGIIIYASRFARSANDFTWIIALSYSAAILSLVVSYTRARAESLGLDCKVGIMERPERVILLGAGLLIGGANGILWVLVVMVVTVGITGLQRIVHVARVSTATSTTNASAPATPTSLLGTASKRPATSARTTKS